eukprot:gene15745-21867_t
MRDPGPGGPRALARAGQSRPGSARVPRAATGAATPGRDTRGCTRRHRHSGQVLGQIAHACSQLKVQQQADDELTRTTAGTDFQDPRHQDGTPVPWLRYFFPRDFDAREGNNENPFFQFFDVKTEPLEEDLIVQLYCRSNHMCNAAIHIELMKCY